MSHFDLSRSDIFSMYGPSFMFSQNSLAGSNAALPGTAVSQPALHPAFYTYPHLPGLYRDHVLPQFYQCPGANHVVYNAVRQVPHQTGDLTRFPFDLAMYSQSRMSELGFSHGFGPPSFSFSSPVPPVDTKVEVRSASSLDVKFYGRQCEQLTGKRPGSALEVKSKKKKRSKSPAKEEVKQTEKIIVSASVKSEKIEVDDATCSTVNTPPVGTLSQAEPANRITQPYIKTERSQILDFSEWRAKSCEPTAAEPLDLSIRPRSKTLPSCNKDVSRTFLSKSDRLEQSIVAIRRYQESATEQVVDSPLKNEPPAETVPDDPCLAPAFIGPSVTPLEDAEAEPEAIKASSEIKSKAEKENMELFVDGGCSRTTPFAKVVLACKQVVDKSVLFCSETLARGSDSSIQIARTVEEQKTEKPAQLSSEIPSRQGADNDTSPMIKDKNIVTSSDVCVKTEQSSPEVLRGYKASPVLSSDDVKIYHSPLSIETGKQSPYCGSFFSPGRGIYPSSPLPKLKSPKCEVVSDLKSVEKEDLPKEQVKVKVEKEADVKKSACLLSKKQGSIPVGIAVARQRTTVTTTTVNNGKSKTTSSVRQNVPLMPRQTEPRPLLVQIAPAPPIAVQSTAESTPAWAAPVGTSVDQQVGISKQSVWVGSAAFSAGNDVTQMLLPQTLPIGNIGYQMPTGSSPLLLIPAACLDPAQRPSIFWPTYQPTWTTAPPIVSLGPPQQQTFQPAAVTIQHHTSYRMVTPVQQDIVTSQCFGEVVKEEAIEKKEFEIEPCLTQSFVTEETSQTTTSVVGFMSPICSQTTLQGQTFANSGSFGVGSKLCLRPSEPTAEAVETSIKIEVPDVGLHAGEDKKGNIPLYRPPKQDAVIQTDTPECSDDDYESEIEQLCDEEEETNKEGLTPPCETGVVAAGIVALPSVAHEPSVNGIEKVGADHGSHHAIPVAFEENILASDGTGKHAMPPVLMSSPAASQHAVSMEPRQSHSDGGLVPEKDASAVRTLVQEKGASATHSRVLDKGPTGLHSLTPSVLHGLVLEKEARSLHVLVQDEACVLHGLVPKKEDNTLHSLALEKEAAALVLEEARSLHGLVQAEASALHGLVPKKEASALHGLVLEASAHGRDVSDGRTVYSPTPRSEFRTLQVSDIGLTCFPVKCDLACEKACETSVPEELKVQEPESQSPDLSGLKLLMDSIDKVEARESEPCDGLDLLSSVAETRLLEKRTSDASRTTFESLCVVASTFCDNPSPTRVEPPPPVIPSKTADLFMDPCELDMRIKMAELQRKYREKQKELHILDGKSPTRRKSVSRKLSASETRAKRVVSDEGKRRSKSASDDQDNVFRDSNDNHQLAMSRIETSSSKKRKLGFPKKNQSRSETTETIVPKKSKIYGMMLNNNEEEWKPKVKPKFRAEVKVRNPSPEPELDPFDAGVSPKPSVAPVVVDVLKSPERPTESPKVKVKSPRPAKKVQPAEPAELPENTEPRAPREDELLEKRRVLVPNEELLSAGHVTLLSPPDIYGVVLDGERKNRPRIYSREEILNESLLEVKVNPSTALPGTRVCAFWSHSSRVLYPGRISSSAKPLELTKGKQWLVDIDFDDGDSGKIPMEDVRILPDSFPVKEYNRDPLKVFERHRKRRDSSHDVAVSKATAAPVEIKESIDDKAQSVLEIGVKKKKKKREKEKRKEKHKHKKRRKEKEGAEVNRTKSESDVCSEMPRLEPEVDSPNLLDVFSEDGVPRRSKKKRRDKFKDENRKRHKSEMSHKSKKGVTVRYPHVTFRMCDAPLLFQSLVSPLRPSLLPGSSTSFGFSEQPDNAGQAIDVKTESTALPLEQNPPAEKSDEPEAVDSCACAQEVEMFSATVVIGEIASEEKNDTYEFEEQSNVDNYEVELEKGEEENDMSEAEGTDDDSTPTGRPFCAWEWHGPGTKRKGKIYYKAIQRGDEIIRNGECALFYSTATATDEDARPYIGRIVSMWSNHKGNRIVDIVKVFWLYFPEDIDKSVRPEAIPEGGLFESAHPDENLLQTIDRKVEVLPVSEYHARVGAESEDVSDLYYSAGFYNVKTRQLVIQPDVFGQP